MKRGARGVWDVKLERDKLKPYLDLTTTRDSKINNIKREP